MAVAERRRRRSRKSWGTVGREVRSVLVRPSGTARFSQPAAGGVLHAATFGLAVGDGGVGWPVLRHAPESAWAGHAPPASFLAGGAAGRLSRRTAVGVHSMGGRRPERRLRFHAPVAVVRQHRTGRAHLDALAPRESACPDSARASVQAALPRRCRARVRGFLSGALVKAVQSARRSWPAALGGRGRPARDTRRRRARASRGRRRRAPRGRGGRPRTAARR